MYDSDVSVEKSGCLSQCDRGPNICIVNDKNEEKLYVGISDPTTASAILEVVTEMDYPIALLLAATMINDAQQGEWTVFYVSSSDHSLKDLIHFLINLYLI